MNATLLEQALAYHTDGFSVIPIRKGEKAPAINWTAYQTTPANEATVKQWFSNGHYEAIGIVTGAVSGGLVILDFDGEGWERARDDLLKTFPELQQTTHVKTGSGKLHIWVKADDLTGADGKPLTRLAFKRPDLGEATAIEVRANTVQTLAPPSRHPSGGVYQFRNDNNLTRIPSLQPIIAWLTDWQADVPAENVFSNWQPVTLGALTKPTPRIPVVEGMLYRSTLSCVFGSPGALKSFVEADLALCVAAGIPWLYPEATDSPLCEFKTRQGAVVWIDFDNGAYTTHERFYALREAHHVTEAPLYIYTMPRPWLNLAKETHQQDFTDWLNALPETPTLVVIDNLAYISGEIPENDPAMKNVMAALKHAAETTGAHVCVIHHERKSNGIKTRAGERMRGSTTIEAGLDLAILVERPDATPTVTIQATKNRILRSFPKIAATLASEHDNDGIMTMARFWQVETEADATDKLDEEVLAILTEKGSVNKTDLAKLAAARSGVGINRARDYIATLADEGALVMSIDETARGKPILCSLA